MELTSVLMILSRLADLSTFEGDILGTKACESQHTILKMMAISTLQCPKYVTCYIFIA